ncbi:MAG: beta-ketoacyl-ACP synthase II [Chloroflexi bacterium]|nr:beta-ketoacyl-ACP synthase II [Chloroflexota bacterium]
MVVTGLGAVTPLGLDVAATWRGLVAGASGIGPISTFDASALATRIAGEVRGFDASRYFEPKLAGRLERFVQFAVAVARQAVADAGLTLGERLSERAGVVMNTGGGGIVAVEREAATIRDRGPRRVSPFFIPMMMSNLAACQVAMELGFRGPAITATAACAAGVQAIVDAVNMIRRGEADVVVAGATESAMTPLMFACLANMQALSRRNGEPVRASRPFDRARDGFVFSEGAGALVLERWEHARRRGARVYGEALGGAMTADAYHVTAPHPDGRGAALAIRRALGRARVRPDEVDLVCAHATSTAAGDVAEARALHTALGERARRVAVSAPKSMLGHLLGAAGAVAAVATVLALRDGVVPPTINLDDQDPDCDLDVVANEPREERCRVGIVNGFGFGGQNAVAVFRRSEG